MGSSDVISPPKVKQRNSHSSVHSVNQQGDACEMVEQKPAIKRTSNGSNKRVRKDTVRRGCLFLAMLALAVCIQSNHLCFHQITTSIRNMLQTDKYEDYQKLRRQEVEVMERVQASFGCLNMTWKECALSIANQKQQNAVLSDILIKLNNLTALLGCTGAPDESECLDHALHRTEYQRAQSNVLKRHVRAALTRAARVPNYTRPVYYTEDHPAFVPMNPTYRPNPKWRETNMADINIVGMPKAGTSHLYKLLTSHRRTTGLHPNVKEFCLPHSRLKQQGKTMLHRDWDEPDYGQLKTSTAQKNVQAMMRNFHRDAYTKIFKNRHLPPGTLTVNACLQWADLEYNWFYLGKPEGKKFIILLRDPVDWSWAAWNFWTQDSLDRIRETNETMNKPPSRWTVVGEQYRSPELFHELVSSGLKTWNGARIIKQRQTSITWIRKLIDLVGRENVLLLRNEDMTPDRVNLPGGLLDQVAAFTGLNPYHFSPKTVQAVTNCNNQKGALNHCEKKSNVYEIAESRTLLPETRPLLYLQYWEECKILSREYNIDYPECVNIMENPSVAPFVAEMQSQISLLSDGSSDDE
jgi:hypothetical protein